MVSKFSSLLYFVIGALLLFLVTKFGIPRFATLTGYEPIIGWFVLSGIFLFGVLFLASVFFFRTHGSGQTWTEYFRLKPLSRGDWAWGIGGLILTGLSSAAIVFLLQWCLGGEVSLHPSFMKLEPLSDGRYWILAAWLPFWVLNILGEELFWRGVLLPNQEKAWGKFAWLINGVGWLCLHLAFGPVLLITLLPILFILPYAVQRTGNTSVGILIHAGLNGPGFLAVAFGIV